jgi:hypothetical protein
VPDALAPLLREGRLRRERTSPQEVAGFLAIARTALDDASIPALSPSGRFKHAYDAAHALALCALRVNDVRPSTGLGHRAIVFEALPASIGLESNIASTLQRYHTRRNKSEYEGLATVSDKEARELLSLATTLESRLVRWIGANRPQLVARP